MESPSYKECKSCVVKFVKFRTKIHAGTIYGLRNDYVDCVEKFVNTFRGMGTTSKNIGRLDNDDKIYLAMSVM